MYEKKKKIIYADTKEALEEKSLNKKRERLGGTIVLIL